LYGIQFAEQKMIQTTSRREHKFWNIHEMDFR